jgi:hypothetical protein
MQRFGVAQSLEARHPCPAPQRLTAPVPPQSTPVSPLFITPSVDFGAAQVPDLREVAPLQTPERQSVPVRQGSPVEQRSQDPPHS